jgi:hypothetical protein
MVILGETSCHVYRSIWANLLDVTVVVVAVMVVGAYGRSIW